MEEEEHWDPGEEKGVGWGSSPVPTLKAAVTSLSLPPAQVSLSVKHRALEQ